MDKRDIAESDGGGAAMAGPAADFEAFAARDVRDLILGYPLAWVCPLAGDPLAATLLPLVGEYDAEGALSHLVGHLARRNPLFRQLADDGRAVALFTGPQAYVSPRDVGDRSWAPTWIYAQVRVELEVDVDAAFTREALDILIQAMESGAEAPWHSAELGPRYEAMLDQIAGFRARVTRMKGKFKLGQDENPSIFARISSGTADPAMRAWMERFNHRR